MYFNGFFCASRNLTRIKVSEKFIFEGSLIINHLTQIQFNQLPQIAINSRYLFRIQNHKWNDHFFQ